MSMPTSRHTALLGLAALGPALIVSAAAPVRALVAAPTAPPINTVFYGGAFGSNTSATVYPSAPGSPYDTQFVGTSGSNGTHPAPGFLLTEFTADALTLNYDDPITEFLAGFTSGTPVPTPANAGTFTGTDVLTAVGGGTLDLSLAGSVSHTGQGLQEQFTLTGAATVTAGTLTGGTLGLSGVAPFNGTLIEELTSTSAVPASLAAPAGVAAPSVQPQPLPVLSAYTAQYGALAPAVPEPTPLALLALAVLPVGLIAARRRRAA